RQATSPDDAIRITLQLGVIHGLGARAAQMYWVSQTPELTSIKTLKVYKWLDPAAKQRLQIKGTIKKELTLKGQRVLAELDPNSEEITSFATKTPLDETIEMHQVIDSMQPMIIMHPENLAHLKDRKPFILYPVRVDRGNFAVFKLKFEQASTRQDLIDSLPHLKRLFSLLSNQLAQIESVFGHQTESLALRIDKPRLAHANLLGMSILAGPFREDTNPRSLKPIVQRVARAQKHGVDMLHLDIMDGVFNQGRQLVGPVTSTKDPYEHFMVLGDFIRYIRPRTHLPIDVHLMVQDTASYIVELMKIGVDLITISSELTASADRPRADLADLVASLHRHDVHAGLAINPATPYVKILPYLGLIDVVTLMSVIPGASGQKFMPEVLPKISGLRGFAQEADLSLGLQVDGGVNLRTVGGARSAGANMVVAASALYRQHNLAKTVQRLKENGA
ncbi:MAG: ribulose-phosphate 3-epimerase, partial [Candidatus Margulisbacteria bacterium]|nr:ribulose-phosphate 3-epimerase [Candidatus Margulisiibacteriota bacterium]